MIYEIGLECEYWLLDKDNNIIEAPMWNFPADGIGFLVEVTSLWSDSPYEIVKSLEAQKELVSSKAARLGFNLLEARKMPVTHAWSEYIIEKYNVNNLPDKTRNIYGHSATQHTGFRDGYATAGLHVHFSKFRPDFDYVDFTREEIVEIVRNMDEYFEDEIGERIKGEWESKPYHHGFEYRSLPATADKHRAATVALSLMG